MEGTTARDKRRGDAEKEEGRSVLSAGRAWAASIEEQMRMMGREHKGWTTGWVSLPFWLEDGSGAARYRRLPGPGGTREPEKCGNEPTAWKHVTLCCEGCYVVVAPGDRAQNEAKWQTGNGDRGTGSRPVRSASGCLFPVTCSPIPVLAERTRRGGKGNAGISRISLTRRDT